MEGQPELQWDVGPWSAPQSAYSYIALVQGKKILENGTITFAGELRVR
jgi:hypothetical protein